VSSETPNREEETSQNVAPGSAPTASVPSIILHGASDLFMTGEIPKPGEPAIINLMVIRCACGFEARAKCWRDAGSILDNHIWQKASH